MRTKFHQPYQLDLHNQMYSRFQSNHFRVSFGWHRLDLQNLAYLRMSGLFLELFPAPVHYMHSNQKSQAAKRQLHTFATYIQAGKAVTAGYDGNEPEASILSAL